LHSHDESRISARLQRDNVTVTAATEERRQQRSKC
jgi:hypothetical protein